MSLPAVTHRVDYAWRLFGTGLGFLLFSLGGGLMSVTVFPLVSVAIRNSKDRVAATRRIIRGLFRLFVGFLIRMGVISLEVANAKSLDEQHGVMVVANHPSLLDVVLLMSLMPEAQCVVKSKLWRSPFLGGVVRAAGYVRNDGDPEKLIGDCVSALRDGQNLVIFPEGSRTTPGVRPKLRRGFAHVALRAEADIVPIAIFCTPPSLTKGEPWFAIPESRISYRVNVHQRLKVGKYASLANRLIAARRLCREVDGIFASELGYDRP